MDLLILNQYFPPDQAATAILLGQLTEELSSYYKITVICGTPTYNPDTSNRRNRTINLHTIPLFSVSRKWIVLRLLNYIIFSIGSLVKALSLPRHSVVLVWTDPPWISGIGACAKFVKGSTLVLVHQDIYPEIILATGKVTRGWLYSFFQYLSTSMVRHADHHVVIGKEMVPILVNKKVPVARITCIENWQNIDTIHPVS